MGPRRPRRLPRKLRQARRGVGRSEQPFVGTEWQRSTSVGESAGGIELPRSGPPFDELRAAVYVVCWYIVYLRTPIFVKGIFEPLPKLRAARRHQSRHF